MNHSAVIINFINLLTMCNCVSTNCY